MAHSSNLTRGTLLYNKDYQRNGLKAYARALQKYNFAPTLDGPYSHINQVHQPGKFGAVGGRARVRQHVLVKKDATSGQTGEVPAEDVEQNSEYLATVGIGTPAQKLNLDFDTGSADLWVFSTELSSSTSTSSHNVFDPKKSSTFKSSAGSTWQIQYGDGSTASGDVGTDTLEVGGLLVEGQAIELAKQLSPEFASGQGDGLLGLAFGSINTVQPNPVATPVENMIKQQDISKDAELFTAYFANQSGNSFYTFGYIDQEALEGQTPTYTPVDNSQGFWMFDSATASVNGKTFDRAGNKSIADTGTTLCLIDDATLETIYGQIKGAKLDQQQQGWVIPSNTAVAALPAVSFAVGDKLFQLKKEDLIFQDLGNGFSYGGLQSRGQQGFDIYGDVFLRGVYAIFDLGNNRFGCTQRSDGAGSGTTQPPTSGGGGASQPPASGGGSSGGGEPSTGGGSGGGQTPSPAQPQQPHHHHHHHHHHHQQN